MRRALVTVLALVALTRVVPARGAIDRRELAKRWVEDAIARGTVDLARGVELRESDDELSAPSRPYGFVARRAPIERGEAYARVAWNETIHPSRYAATDGGLGALLASMRSEYGEDEKTALLVCLIYERFEKGEHSAFDEYFRMMPEEFDTPAHWSETTARELRGSDVYERDIVEEFKLLDKVWKTLRLRVFEPHGDVFKGEAAKSLYALQWAWSVVHSRAMRVSGKTGLAIVPVIEMVRECDDTANDEDLRSNETLSEDEGDGLESSFAVYDPHTDEVVVYAKSDYEPGAELCERHGGRNLAESVQHLGYLPVLSEKSKRNCVLLVLEPERQYIEKVRRAGFTVPWRVCVPLSATERSLDLLAAYANLASGADVEIGNDGIPRNVSRDAARELLAERLKRFPTTKEEDSAALSSMRNSIKSYLESIEKDKLELLERARYEEKIRQLRRSMIVVELRSREKRILASLIDGMSPLSTVKHDEL